MLDTLTNAAEFVYRLTLPWAAHGYLLGRWVEMALAGALLGALLAGLMKVMPPGGLIARRRRAVLATMGEMVLMYRRPGAVVRAQVRLIGQSLGLLACLAPLVLTSGLLFAAVYKPLENRYGYSPLGVGQQAVVRVQAPPGALAAALLAADARPSAPLRVTAKVRCPGRDCVWYEVVGDAAGRTHLDLDLPGGLAPVPLSVGATGGPAARRIRVRQLDVRVDYPPCRALGGRYGWLAYVLVAMTLAAWWAGCAMRVRL